MKYSAKIISIVIMIQCLSRITPLLRKKSQRKDSGNFEIDPNPEFPASCWTQKMIEENGKCKYTPVNQIIIPGTHDSGFYLNPLKDKYKGKFSKMTFPPMESEADMETYDSKDPFMKERAERGKFVLEKSFWKYHVKRYSVTQYYDLLTQMKIGVRMFDIRFDYSNGSKDKPGTFNLKHGVLERDTNLNDALNVAGHFLDNLCHEDFLIYKLKIEGGKPTEDTIKAFEDPKNGVDKKFVFFPEGYMPTIEELQGKLWIIPDGDFKAKEILKNHPTLIKKNPNNLMPAAWKTAVIKGHDVNKEKEEDKIKEYKTWKERINANKKEDQNKFMYFGFNVVAHNPVAIAGDTAVDAFRKVGYGVAKLFGKDVEAGKNELGTRIGIDLFDHIYMKDTKKPKRGVIAMDWAMPIRISQVINSFDPASCGKETDTSSSDESSTYEDSITE